MGQILSGILNAFRAILGRLGIEAPLSAEERRRRDENYRTFLANAERQMDSRFLANSCPRERIENFKVLGHLASGGYGEIFLVEYKADRKRYVLKVQPKAGFSEREVPFAIREKKLLHALQFEFIVKLYFAFQDARNLYLVMERAPFGDFSEFFGEQLSMKTYKIFAAQIVLAIEYLHECKIVHRDLKPFNILVFENGCLKLADFGFAKKVYERTWTNVGTPHYCAPEIFGKSGYGKGVDWWAVGVIFFILLYNRHPFADFSMGRTQVIAALERIPLTFPGRVDPNSPECNLLSGLLEKNASKRLGSLDGRAQDIKNHPWFADICFFAVLNRKLRFNVRLKTKGAQMSQKCRFIPGPSESNVRVAEFSEF